MANIPKTQTQGEKIPSDLTPELADFIAVWKPRAGNLIMVLHRVQKEFGYLPEEYIRYLSLALDTPLAKIYGVITFYHFFKLEKPGEQHVQVCMGTACYLKGADKLLDVLEKELQVPEGKATPDGKFSYEAVRCIGCCGLAPVITVGSEVYGKLAQPEMRDVIAKYR